MIPKSLESHAPVGTSEHILWSALDDRRGIHDTGLAWVRAHIGKSGNEETDGLASKATIIAPGENTLTTQGIRERIREEYGPPREFTRPRDWSRHNVSPTLPSRPLALSPSLLPSLLPSRPRPRPRPLALALSPSPSPLLTPTPSPLLLPTSHGVVPLSGPLFGP
ncbi:hypothetical protein DFH27DRAFT_609771 [Peziza echinospora]|nr:hypothetical protein DFH27DRAFT_609771 [Peziza echinospora]